MTAGQNRRVVDADSQNGSEQSEQGHPAVYLEDKAWSCGTVAEFWTLIQALGSAPRTTE